MITILNSKRGSVVDIYIILVFALFGFALMILLGSKFIGALNTQFQALDVNYTSDSDYKGLVSGLNDKYHSVMDKLFLFLIIGLVIATLIGAYLIGNNPIFFAVSIIMLIIIIFLSVVLNNVYQTFTGSAAFAGEEANFPIMTLLMNNILGVVILISLLVLVVLFAKGRTETL